MKRSGISDFEAIYAEWKQSPDGRIGPIHERLGGEHSYDTLKLVRLFLD